MNRNEINKREWNNPDNWQGGFLGIYYSKEDTRSWVPKRIPWMGWTINFAKTSGVLSLVMLMIIPIIIVLFIIAFL